MTPDQFAESTARLKKLNDQVLDLGTDIRRAAAAAQDAARLVREGTAMRAAIQQEMVPLAAAIRQHLAEQQAKAEAAAAEQAQANAKAKEEANAARAVEAAKEAEAAQANTLAAAAAERAQLVKDIAAEVAKNLKPAD